MITANKMHPAEGNQQYRQMYKDRQFWKASLLACCTFYVIVYLSPKKLQNREDHFLCSSWNTACVRVKYMNERMHTNPGCLGLWHIHSLHLQVVYGQRTKQSKFSVNLVEWIQECVHTAHQNVCLSQRQARDAEQAAPWRGCYASSVDPAGAPGLLSHWFNYCALKSALQPFCLLSCCSKLQNGEIKKAGKDSFGNPDPGMSPKIVFSFTGVKRRQEKLGERIPKLAKHINQQNCVTTSTNV